MNDSISRRGWIASLKAALAGASAGWAGAAQAQQAPRYVHPRRVFLGENTRKEFREALEQGRIKAAIIPTGSTEQHNEHLALDCDATCATLISQQAALRLYPAATVSTACPLGYAPYHMARKGTITLRKETFKAYVYDVIHSLAAHGIRTILVVNGHFGNHTPLAEAIPEWRKELGITLDTETYISAYRDDELAGFLTSYRLLKKGKLDTIARRTAMTHASEVETSILMAAHPERVRAFTMDEYDRAAQNFESGYSPTVARYLEPFTKEGWPKGANPENARDRARQEQALYATKEKGERLIELATRYIAGKVEKMIEATEKGAPWPPAA